MWKEVAEKWQDVAGCKGKNEKDFGQRVVGKVS